MPECSGLTACHMVITDFICLAEQDPQFQPMPTLGA